ncbi:MAG: exported protein of unknown function, partial [Candidatus Saccharibacteria bacterium]|nr:exported protein of unknown function [Candidatus Saccharibacteria bacterium]
MMQQRQTRKPLLMSLPWIMGLLLVTYLAITFLTPTHPVKAATSSTLNFQARLLTSGGGIVADGNYHIEFKLYNVSSGGSALWTETRTTGSLVPVKAGYLTVNLGSVTAFPGTINWDQEHWITMNVGGAGGSATWDGEMSPRLKLTAVPYAFKAGQLAQFNGTTSFTSTLSLVQPTGGSQTFQIADQ